jgi:hypothetical protein
MAPGAPDGPLVGLRTKAGTELLVWASSTGAEYPFDGLGHSTAQSIVLRPRAPTTPWTSSPTSTAGLCVSAFVCRAADAGTLRP